MGDDSVLIMHKLRQGPSPKVLDGGSLTGACPKQGLGYASKLRDEAFFWPDEPQPVLGVACARTITAPPDKVWKVVVEPGCLCLH